MPELDSIYGQLQMLYFTMQVLQIQLQLDLKKQFLLNYISCNHSFIAIDNDLHYIYKNDKSTHFQSHFGVTNRKAAAYFAEHGGCLFVDWTFLRLHSRTNLAVQTVCSLTSSKLSFIVSFYIVVKGADHERSMGENLVNTNLGLKYFADQINFQHCKYLLTDMGVCYTHGFKNRLNQYLEEAGKPLFTGVHQYCSYHHHEKVKVRHKLISDDGVDLKAEMHATFYSWVSAGFITERTIYRKRLDQLYAEAGLANTDPYMARLNQLDQYVDKFSIIARPNEFSILAVTTQSAESLNFTRIKHLLNHRSELYDIIVKLSGIDRTFINTVEQHIKQNNKHISTSILQGCVYKANKIVSQQQKQSSFYNVELKKGEYIIKLFDKVVVNVSKEKWNKLKDFTSDFETKLVRGKTDQVLQAEIEQIFQTIRCGCSWQVQSGLICRHEFAMFSELGINNKIVFSYMVRPEFKQSWFEQHIVPSFSNLDQQYVKHSPDQNSNIIKQSPKNHYRSMP
ncbi:Hypothetical_protein [Hexamita inflata]|uniref:Hypothetical_protein n=1 Tax=Hexamita inflata TaxID=28002 RepID=A0ABP1HQ40_9EUKA